MTTVGSAHARLPRLDRAQARHQTALVAALVSAGLWMRPADPATRPPLWIACRSGGSRLWLSPRLAAGVPVDLRADDGGPCAAAAMTALEHLEPLIVRIEQALAIAIRPHDLEPLPPGATVVEVADDGGGHLVTLAIERELLPPGRPVRADGLPAGCRMRLSATIDLPPLRADRLADLCAGALLLLGLGPNAGGLAVQAARFAALFDLSARTCRIVDRPRPETGDPMTIDDPGLSLALRIDGADIALSAAGALGPGSVVELPAGPTLAVTVIVGGAAIARGNLVAVGDGFGVLVTARLADL